MLPSCPAFTRAAVRPPHSFHPTVVTAGALCDTRASGGQSNTANPPSSFPAPLPRASQIPYPLSPLPLFSLSPCFRDLTINTDVTDLGYAILRVVPSVLIMTLSYSARPLFLSPSPSPTVAPMRAQT
jgi:hypothetical protein